MKGYSSRELLKILKDDGWILDHVVGDHHIFIHPTKPGIVVVPHPNKDLPIGTIKSIAKQAGIRLE